MCSRIRPCRRFCALIPRRLCVPCSYLQRFLLWEIVSGSQLRRAACQRPDIELRQADKSFDRIKLSVELSPAKCPPKNMTNSSSGRSSSNVTLSYTTLSCTSSATRVHQAPVHSAGLMSVIRAFQIRDASDASQYTSKCASHNRLPLAVLLLLYTQLPLRSCGSSSCSAVQLPL